MELSRVAGAVGTVLAAIAMVVDWITVDGDFSLLEQWYLASEGVTLPESFTLLEMTILLEEPEAILLALFAVYAVGLVLGALTVFQPRIRAWPLVLAGVLVLGSALSVLVYGPMSVPEDVELTIEMGTYLAALAGAVVVGGGLLAVFEDSAGATQTSAAGEKQRPPEREAGGENRD